MSMLREIVYQAHVVNNNLDALQALAENHYGLFLIDYLMPEMNGLQTTIQIHQPEQGLSNKPSIPIIGLSANAQEEIVEHYLDSGMNSSLSKLFSKQQLQDVLKRWVPIKHTEPNGYNLESTVVNSNPVELENLCL